MNPAPLEAVRSWRAPARPGGFSEGNLRLNPDAFRLGVEAVQALARS